MCWLNFQFCSGWDCCTVAQRFRNFVQTFPKTRDVFSCPKICHSKVIALLTFIYGSKNLRKNSFVRTGLFRRRGSCVGVFGVGVPFACTCLGARGCTFRRCLWGGVDDIPRALYLTRCFVLSICQCLIRTAHSLPE